MEFSRLESNKPVSIGIGIGNHLGRFNVAALCTLLYRFLHLLLFPLNVCARHSASAFSVTHYISNLSNEKMQPILCPNLWRVARMQEYLRVEAILGEILKLRKATLDFMRTNKNMNTL